MCSSDLPRPTPLENRPPYVPRHDATPQPTLRDRLAVADGVPILLYQGGIQGGRGLHMLVNAMAHVPHGVLVLLGNGRLTEELRGLSSRLGVADRVFFLPAVPLADLPAITASADIGVHPLEDNCLNHRWASPNKLYEYVHAGLPVVASDLPAMAAVIRAHDIGACFRADDAMDLARVLSRFVEDGSLRQHHADRARAAAPQLAWENEAPKLLALYETLGS